MFVTKIRLTETSENIRSEWFHRSHFYWFFLYILEYLQNIHIHDAFFSCSINEEVFLTEVK
jgi:hypothetical protein